MKLLTLTILAVLMAAPAAAQVAPPPAKSDREAVQHGAQPNSGEVVTKTGRRVFGLPVTAALLVAGLIIALVVVGGIVIPGASRRRRARGGGTYGRPERRSPR